MGRRALLGLAALALAFTGGCDGCGLATHTDAGPAQVAAKEAGPARAPPSLRDPRPPVPALPDLPSLEAQQASPKPGATAPAPASASQKSGGICGSVWTGDGFAPLACMKSAMLFGHRADDATALVPTALLALASAQLPRVVDHRLDGTEGPVRSQGRTPACTAFSSTAALEHAAARWNGKVVALSVMEFFARYHEAIVESAIDKNVGLALAPEATWPFNATELNGWLACPAGAAATTCGKPVNAARVPQADAHAAATFTRVEHIPKIDVETLREHLAAGQDVVVGMSVTDTFTTAGRAGARYVANYTRVGAEAGHAVVLAGYATLPHGTYFLVHNSWGTTWGDGGYAWIHETTLTKWATDALVLEAEPVVRDASQRPLRARGETTCDPGLVPDSIRGTCAPPCPDASPRHDGVCAIAGQCPASFVNLTGVCVLAAPTVSGRANDSGIAWACGPGGCSYTVPRSYDAACTGEICKVSCPAPDFRLARSKASLICVE